MPTKTPDQIAASGTEHAHQRAFFAWCNMAARYGFAVADDDVAYSSIDTAMASQVLNDSRPVHYLHLIHAIHNQGHGDAIRGARARAEGVKAGIPDIMWPRPTNDYAGLYIELKRPKDAKKTKGKTSEKQDDIIDQLRLLGYCVVVAVGWREAADAVNRYLERL